MSVGIAVIAAAVITTFLSKKEISKIELEKYNKCPSCEEIQYKIFMQEKHLVECVKCGYVYPRELEEEI